MSQTWMEILIEVEDLERIAIAIDKEARPAKANYSPRPARTARIRQLAQELRVTAANIRDFISRDHTDRTRHHLTIVTPPA